MPLQIAKVTVVNAGARVPLAVTKTPATVVVIQADPGNSGSIYVGDVTVSASLKGATLAFSGQLTLPATTAENPYDLSQIYVDASTNNQVANVTWLQL